MRIGMRAVAAALLLLVGTAFADPFTGRYLVEGRATTSGNFIFGYIDLAGVPMGANSFTLASATDFSFSISRPGGVITWTKSDGIGTDTEITFDNPIGAQTLTAVSGSPESLWQSVFGQDLGGKGPARDRIRIFADGRGWLGADFDQSPITIFGRWTLELASSTPVPEPGTLVLSGLAVAGVLVSRRRKHKA